ncbi:hypothetical protein D043_1580B, partial [Vibrio parahaemolyticus EKP-021]
TYCWQAALSLSRCRTERHRDRTGSRCS